jgi:hypothetical protein
MPSCIHRAPYTRRALRVMTFLSVALSSALPGRAASPGVPGLDPVAVLMALDENDAASKAFLSALTQGLSP